MAVAQNREMSAVGSVLFLTVLGTVSQVLGFGYRVALSRMVCGMSTRSPSSRLFS